jgi:hypothetical protein
MVIAIVPVEEMPAEDLGVLDRAEAFGEFRLIFQGFEVTFGNWGKSPGDQAA